MRLDKLIENLAGVKKVRGDLTQEIRGISDNSKRVKNGELFVALKGSMHDGRDFIGEALSRGAGAILLEHNKEIFSEKDATLIFVEDARCALGEILSSFHGEVSSDLSLFGITGTNGKTTVTYLVESLFKSKGEDAGLIGTINYRFGERVIPAFNTTPGIIDLYSYFNEMKRNSIKNAILEVSSHALEQGRVDGLRFEMCVFTNLSEEHLDYHKDIQSYLLSKMKLFTKIKKGGFAIINADDSRSGQIIEKVKAEHKARLTTYGIQQPSDVSARDIEISLSGSRFKVSGIEIDSPLIGLHNVYNILAGFSVGMALGMDPENIKEALEKVKGVPGRLERIEPSKNFYVFIDYAHTKDGLLKVLGTLKSFKTKRIITVFGCGGERDRGKRPLMGKVATEFSDKVFITTDNPRGEDPLDIAGDIIEGIDKGRKNFIVELDRAKAIKLALKEAGEGDIVLVAGKGHESSQIFKDYIIPFNDKEVIINFLKE